MKKRLLTKVLAFAWLLSTLSMTPVFAEASPSKDETKEPIDTAVVERIISCGGGYIDGYPDGTFRPEKLLTRAEAAALIAKLQHLPLTDKRADTSSYVDGWYNAHINAVVKSGYMKGYPNGAFEPNEPIMRGEFAKVLSGFLSGKAAPSPFKDMEGSWAKEAVDMVYAQGIIKGYEDNTFRPTCDVSRAEAVAMLNRTFKIKKATDGKISFSDVSEDHWAYDDILSAAGYR